MNTVLLLTYSEDFYTIDLVGNALKDLGLDAIRVNTDHYPEQIPIDIKFSQNSNSIKWNLGGRTIHNQDIRGVWNRRIWSPKIDPSISEGYRNICVRESKHIFKSLFPLLNNAVWMDPDHVVEAASNKLLQLNIASQVGLTIPSTLVSNNPDSAKVFYNENNGGLITKMALPTAFSMNHTAMAMRTHAVKEEDINNMDNLKHCPMIFQEEIKKEIELRVVYVNGHFFTGAINASGSVHGKVDWRLSTGDETYWEAYELPEKIKNNITKLMNQFQLTYGALDLIKTKAGQYVFLEVNPVGEWGMLQRDLNYPIAETIAKSLHNRINK